MTKSAMVKQSDLNRLAHVAKANDMTIEVEIDGKVIRFIPGIHATNPQQKDDVDEYADVRL